MSTWTPLLRPTAIYLSNLAWTIAMESCSRSPNNAQIRPQFVQNLSSAAHHTDTSPANSSFSPTNPSIPLALKRSSSMNIPHYKTCSRQTWISSPSPVPAAVSVAAPPLYIFLPTQIRQPPTLLKSTLKREVFTQAFGSKCLYLLNSFHIKRPWVSWKPLHKLKV